MKKISILLMGSLLLSLVACDPSGDLPVATTERFDSENSVISNPTVWESGTVKIIDCSLDVQSSLVIEPGCTVKFTPNGSLQIGFQASASLVADGTPEKPILFIPENGTQAGSWYGISFGSFNTAATTRFNNCVFEGAGKNMEPCLSLTDTRIAMDSCIVRNAGGIGVQLSGASGFNLFAANALSSCAGYLLQGEPQCLLGLDSTNVFQPTGNQAIAIAAGTVTASGTLTRQPVSYTVLDMFGVMAELTIEKGTTLQFKPDAYLAIGQDGYAALIAEGTVTEPIRFTSAAPTPQAGDWEGIIFYEGNSTAKSILKHAIVEYAGKASGTFESAIYAFSGFRFENCEIRNSANYGVYFREDAGFVTCSNNVIASCGKDPIHLFADQAHTVGSGNSLSAGAGMGIHVEGESISQNVRWLKQTVPYVIEGVIYVSTTTGTARWTIDPGCTLAFLKSASVSVLDNGSLVAEGTASDLIAFTSNAATPSPGDWDGIYFAHESYGGNVLKNCKIEYGGNYTEYNLGIHTSNLSVTDCTIAHSKVNGIYVYYNEPAYTPTIRNITYTGNLVANLVYEQ